MQLSSQPWLEVKQPRKPSSDGIFKISISTQIAQRHSVGVLALTTSNSLVVHYLNLLYYTLLLQLHLFIYYATWTVLLTLSVNGALSRYPSDAKLEGHSVIVRQCNQQINSLFLVFFSLIGNIMIWTHLKLHGLNKIWNWTRKSKWLTSVLESYEVHVCSWLNSQPHWQSRWMIGFDVLSNFHSPMIGATCRGSTRTTITLLLLLETL